MASASCRMHGGASTGPRTAEGLARSRRARWKHGLYSAEARAEQKRTREHCGRRITGNPEVIGSSVGSVPRNALVLTDRVSVGYSVNLPD